MRTKTLRFSLVGPGRLGQAVARRLREAGYAIDAIVGRDLKRAAEAARFIGAAGRESTELAAAGGSDLVLLSVPDDALSATAGRLIGEKILRPETVLVHFSGIHRAEIMLEQAGGVADIGVLSIHPLQTFADPQRGYAAQPGTACAIEGSPHLLPLAEEIVEALQGVPFRLASEHKALYHAAACITSNYLVTLVAAAQKILSACNFSADEGRRLLGPLLQTTARNVAELGPVEALTGPIARGDTRTVGSHLQALETRTTEADLYRFLGQMTVDVGIKKGTLCDSAAAEMKKLLG